MEEELKAFRTPEGNPYRLLPLPMADAIYDINGERLPATYANFLIMNEAVLLPTYNQPHNDTLAKKYWKSFSRKRDCRCGLHGIDQTTWLASLRHHAIS